MFIITILFPLFNLFDFVIVVIKSWTSSYCDFVYIIIIIRSILVFLKNIEFLVDDNELLNWMSDAEGSILKNDNWIYIQ